jgi:hypothetical protein
MRIPGDPFLAEALFCRTPRWTMLETSGEGGDAFHWRCPEPLALTRLRGSFSTTAGSLSRVLGGCTDLAGSTQPPLLGPAFGPEADVPFELACPAGMRAVGIFGHADSVVHALGLSCSAEGGPRAQAPRAVTRTNPIGKAVGASFEFLCPPGQSVRLLRGRVGALVDAVGVGCQADPTARPR